MKLIIAIFALCLVNLNAKNVTQRGFIRLIDESDLTDPSALKAAADNFRERRKNIYQICDVAEDAYIKAITDTLSEAAEKCTAEYGVTNVTVCPEYNTYAYFAVILLKTTFETGDKCIAPAQGRRR